VRVDPIHLRNRLREIMIDLEREFPDYRVTVVMRYAESITEHHAVGVEMDPLAAFHVFREALEGMGDLYRRHGAEVGDTGIYRAISDAMPIPVCRMGDTEPTVRVDELHRMLSATRDQLLWLYRFTFIEPEEWRGALAVEKMAADCKRVMDAAEGLLAGGDEAEEARKVLRTLPGAGDRLRD